MKLIRASTGPASRSEAWACATANLALPGSGSLMAGKTIGYWQLALAAVALIVTFVTGIHLMQWMVANYARLQNPNIDPFQALSELMHAVAGPLAGIGLFICAILWAAVTSYGIMASHPKNPVPPRIAG